MRPINSSVEIVPTDPSLKGIYRAIEKAGRICYDSVGTRYFRLPCDVDNDLFARLCDDDNIVIKEPPIFDESWYISIQNKHMKDYPELLSFPEEEFEDSAYYEDLSSEDFVKMVMGNGHGSVLEHGTVYLDIDIAKVNYENPESYEDLVNFYDKNPFSRVSFYNEPGETGHLAITTNMRVLFENNCMGDLQWLCEPTKHHPKRIMTHWTCSRSVSHELVRHRSASFSQQSQRYINYSKDKYNHEIAFIKANYDCDRLYDSYRRAEKDYMDLIANGLKPEEARAVLPNQTATQLYITAFKDDWDHFFQLRCSQRAHPDIRCLAEDLRRQMNG